MSANGLILIDPVGTLYSAEWEFPAQAAPPRSGNESFRSALSNPIVKASAPFRRRIDWLQDLSSRATIAIFAPDFSDTDLRASLVKFGFANSVEHIFAGQDAKRLASGELTGGFLSEPRTPTRRVFVSTSAYYRARMADRFHSCPSLLLAEASLDGSPIDYFEFTHVGARNDLRQMFSAFDLAPVYIEGFDENWTVRVLGNQSNLEKLVAAHPRMERQTMLRDVGASEIVNASFGVMSQSDYDDYHKAILALNIQAKLSFDGLLAAVPGFPVIELPHPPHAPHGHSRSLRVADSLYFESTDDECPTLDYCDLDCDDKKLLDRDTTKPYEDLLFPLCGKMPLPDGTTRVLDRRRDSDGNREALCYLKGWFDSLPSLRTTCPLFDVNDVKRPNLEARLGDETPEGIVIVAAHFDSENEYKPHCEERRDIAPGADDNASGVAAVQLIALTLLDVIAAKRSQTLRRQVRFVLFDAEETLMQGSTMYALQLTEAGVLPVATIVLDMVGWRDARRRLEFQVRGPGTFANGHESLSCRSEVIADVIEKAAGQLIPCFKLTRTDICGVDPLADRSDHVAFFALGLPACIVTEPGTESAGIVPLDTRYPEFNPSYHTACDTKVDVDLATDVARAVAGAVWMMIKPEQGA